MAEELNLPHPSANAESSDTAVAPTFFSNDSEIDDLSMEAVEEALHAISFIDGTHPNELATKRAKLARRHNELTPIYKLPNELLEYIIHHVFSLGLWTVERLDALCSVSVWWRNVIVASPRLWANINAMDKWERALKASGNADLTVYLPPRGSLTDSQNERLQRLLVPATPRIKCMQILHAYGFPTSLLYLVERCDLPILEELVISINMFTIELRGFSASAIRHLDLDNVSFQWDKSWPMPQLVDIYLRQMETPDVPTGHEIIRFLQGCPQLQSIMLEYWGAPTRSDNTPPDLSLDLPHLVSFGIEDIHETVLGPLLKSLHAPMLMDVEIGLGKGYFNDRPTNPSTLLRLLSDPRGRGRPSFLNAVLTRSAAQRLHIDFDLDWHVYIVPDELEPLLCLTSTSFSRGWFDNQDTWSLIRTFELPTDLRLTKLPNYSNFLQCLPHLVELRCDSTTVDPVLDLLCIPEQTEPVLRWPCPKLATLRLDGPSISQDTLANISRLLNVRHATDIGDPSDPQREGGPPDVALKVLDAKDSVFNTVRCAFQSSPEKLEDSEDGPHV